MSPPALLTPILVSACLGALVGLIRQWSEQLNHRGDEHHFGGVRTHTFWAVLGCIAAYASREHTPLALPVVLVAVAAHLISLRTPVEPGVHLPGSTSFAASLLTLFVGALVCWDLTKSAVLLAATTMVMLGLKQPLHAWTRAFTPQDIRVTLQFAAITGVILPLVPHQAMGPFGAFNPYTTWLLVVLISGLGFAGYLAMRLLGERAGTLLTSLLGGLASSTATTLAFSRRSREDPAQSELYAFAVVTACTVMLPRVVATVALLDPTLAVALLPTFAAMALPGVAYATWFWLTRHRNEAADAVPSPQLANPLGLSTAIKFALLYALIAFLVKAFTHLELRSGLLPLSFVSGLTDMDAIALSMADNTRAGSVTLSLAAQAVTLGAVANSLLKTALAASLGAPALRGRVTVVLGLTAAIGAGGAWWLG